MHFNNHKTYLLQNEESFDSLYKVASTFTDSSFLEKQANIGRFFSRFKKNKGGKLPDNVIKFPKGGGKDPDSPVNFSGRGKDPDNVIKFPKGGGKDPDGPVNFSGRGKDPSSDPFNNTSKELSTRKKIGLGAGAGAVALPSALTGVEAAYDYGFKDPNKSVEDWAARKSPFDWVPGVGISDDELSNLNKAVDEASPYFKEMNPGHHQFSESLNQLKNQSAGLPVERFGKAIKDTTQSAIESNMGNNMGLWDMLRYYLANNLGVFGGQKYVQQQQQKALSESGENWSSVLENARHKIRGTGGTE